MWRTVSQSGIQDEELASAHCCCRVLGVPAYAQRANIRCVQHRQALHPRPVPTRVGEPPTSGPLVVSGTNPRGGQLWLWSSPVQFLCFLWVCVRAEEREDVSALSGAALCGLVSGLMVWFVRCLPIVRVHTGFDFAMNYFVCACFGCVCLCRHGLCRDPSDQGGDLCVEVAWISQGRGRSLGELPSRVLHSGDWGWGEGAVRNGSYLHTWA